MGIESVPMRRHLLADEPAIRRQGVDLHLSIYFSETKSSLKHLRAPIRGYVSTKGKIVLVVKFWRASLSFFLAVVLLVLDSPPYRAPGGLCLFARCRWLKDVQNQLPQLFFAIRDVLLLGSMPLACDDKLTFRR